MKRAVAAIGLALLTGCGGVHQSALDTAGPQAGRIATLFWGFLWVLGLVFVAVMAFTLWSLTRKHRGIEQEPLEQLHLPSAETEDRLHRAVLIATVATARSPEPHQEAHKAPGAPAPH